MPIRHAVLGLLLERRGYGYDLAQRLAERVGPAWKLKPAAVYTALDQLEEAGHIVGVRRAVVGSQANRATRRAGRVIYEPTDAGAVAFRAWLGRPSTSREPIRMDLQLKLVVAGPQDRDALLDVIEHEESLTRRLLTDCREAAEDPRARLVRAGVVARLEAELSWIAATRDALNQDR